MSPMQLQPQQQGDALAQARHALQSAAGAAAASPLGQHLLGMAGSLAQWRTSATRMIAERASSASATTTTTHRRRLNNAPPRIVVLPRDTAFAAILPGDSIAEQVITTGFLNFLNLYNSALILRLVLTWFPSVPEAISQPLATICDPYLNLFRGIIPPIGGTLDLSPILAFVTLNFFTSTAAALPCEMGADGKPPAKLVRQGWQQWLQPSRYEQMWARRMEGQRALAAAAAERTQ